MEGAANAHEIRDLILSRLRRSKTAGLGDDELPERGAAAGFSAAHINVLREIRDVLGGE